MGNGVSVWKSKNAQTWIFQVSYKDADGNRRRIQRRAKSKREALARANEILRSPKLNQMHERKPTVSELIRHYKADQENRMRSSTLANNLHLLGLYSVPQFGNRRIDSLTAPMVSKWMQDLKGKGLKISTINTARAKLHALFQFAVQRELLDANPISKVPPFKAQANSSTQVCDPWSLEEAKSALAAFKGNLIEIFVAFALTTGMRKGEILALRWCDIDFESNQIRISKSRGEKRIVLSDERVITAVEDGFVKTRASLRSLPLPSLVRHLLETRRATLLSEGHAPNDQDYVVTGENRQAISPSFLAKVFKRTLQIHGIRRIRIHDLRHTSAVLALEAQVPLEDVSQGLGHNGIEVTKRIYAPVVPALSDRFVNRISEVLS